MAYGPIVRRALQWLDFEKERFAYGAAWFFLGILVATGSIWAIIPFLILITLHTAWRPRNVYE